MKKEFSARPKYFFCRCCLIMLLLLPRIFMDFCVKATHN